MSTLQTKAGLVGSYDIRSGNGVGLLWQNGKGCKSKKTNEAVEANKKLRKERINVSSVCVWNDTKVDLDVMSYML